MRLIVAHSLGVPVLLAVVMVSATALADDVVLVELFTSQGCSSCPPADQLLSDLGHDKGSPEIVPLSFHVDYWNHIGWKDQFSSSKWSKRQRAYATKMRPSRTYTPQVVVQGEVDCVGSNERCIREAVQRMSARPSAGTVEIVQAREIGGSVFVDAEAKLVAGHQEAVATVVVYESGLSTDVRRGENRGRQLRNDFVVRALQAVGTIPAGDDDPRRVTARIPVQDSWRIENIGVAVFLANPSSRKILGADRAPLDGQIAKLQPLPKAERVPVSEVALGGYCPVALVEGARLVKGSPTLQYRHQGAVYQMTNQAAAAKFASRPASYVPPFSVFDPVVYSESRERTTGSLNVFTLHEGRPWFFLNTDNMNKFLLRPDPYIQNALSR